MGYETQKQEPFLDPGRLNGTFLTVTRGKVDQFGKLVFKTKTTSVCSKIGHPACAEELKKKSFTGCEFIALLHCFSLPTGQLACLKRKTERIMYLGLLDLNVLLSGLEAAFKPSLDSPSLHPI